ncbi:hypothetical protein NDU88_005295 [Pleurodeles waltl]|uniref:Uncharacterized protein n=1 Tax=Pleurodeles waltl TaxID=8319 RepID=A0AAV7UJ62_PLEWA|nr:hypothetical protein NDU88_005295 [Pleurodeles waltl]
MPQTTPCAFTWKLPPATLWDAVFREEIHTEIVDFFIHKKDSVNSPSTPWEAFKAVLRATCIVKQSGVLRAIRRSLTRQEQEIRTLDTQYFTSKDAGTLVNIHDKLMEFQEEALRETRYLYRNAQAQCYGEGDRPGKILAGLLRPPWALGYIAQLYDSDSNLVFSSPEILNAMSTFYAQLYTATPVLGRKELTNYFVTIQLIWLDSAHHAYLDVPITTEEIIHVISDLPGYRAPGLDGLTTAFYKEYAPLLAPHLLAMSQESLQTGSFLSLLWEAVIITLLEPDNPTDSCDLHRPLFFINIDT